MGKDKTTRSTTKQEPWSPAQPYLNDLVTGTRGAYQQGLFDVPEYPGVRVAPQSAMTQRGMDQVYNTATGNDPYAAGAQQMFSDFASGNNTYRDFDQLKANTLADVIPAVSSRFANSGMLDSSIAQDTIARSASEAIAPIEYGAWNQQQDRRMNAMQMAPGLSESRYMPGAQLLQAGQMQDQYGQKLADASAATYYENMMRPYEQLRRGSSLGFGFGGLGGTGTGTQTQPGGGVMETIGQIAQIGGNVAAMVGASDRRLKTDIERIGSTVEGYPKYTYRYVWDEPGTKRIGVMADEVPVHLTAEVAGYKAVDYAQIDLGDQ